MNQGAVKIYKKSHFWRFTKSIKFLKDDTTKGGHLYVQSIPVSIDSPYGICCMEFLPFLLTILFKLQPFKYDVRHS